ncbi:LysM peptidoglycan-binding domain-containing protein [Mycobacterium sp. SP-6446]|uniref:LysM peptidoglycan-binding domain-containing protein n=1 Tax=Mycobacterium sp. SP-6446 TaxID=1834162 RepID=UPI00158CEAAB|nr:LysM peptidoglycan-binding domain-containing protein [Mycobacterium sp. SP-6446]
MGLYLPPQLDWVGYIAGNPWPTEDEDDYWAIADDWSAARDRILALLPGGSAHPNLGTATNAMQQAYPVGAGGDAMRTALQGLAAGDGSLADLAGQMKLVVDAANSTGAKIRELKIMILESLVLLAWELATSYLFPPTAPAADAEEIGSTRIYLQWLLREARLEIERFCEPLLGVFRAVGRLVSGLVEPVTDAVERFGGAIYGAVEDAAGETAAKAVSYLPKLAWETAPSTVKFVGAQDVIAQADPVIEHRSGFNYEELGVSLVSAEAGTLAAVPGGNFAGATLDKLLGGLGADTSQGLAGGIRGLAAGGFGNVCSGQIYGIASGVLTTGKPQYPNAEGLIGAVIRGTAGFPRGSIGELGAAPDSVGRPPEPGVRTVRNEAGELVTTAVDKTGRTTMTTTSTDSGGRLATRTVGPDGSVTTRTADGGAETRHDGYTTTTTADGKTRTTAPDGSTTVTATDGTRVTERHGATTATLTKADGEVTATTVGNQVTVRMPDGAITTTHNDSGALTVTHTTAGGYTVTAHSDGSVTTTDPAGRTTTEPAPASPESPQSPPVSAPKTSESFTHSGAHLTPNDDEPHNQHLAHNEPLPHNERQAWRREAWHTMRQERLQPARDALAERQQAETEQLTQTHREQQQTADPSQRDELSARQREESDRLAARHQAEQDKLDQAQRREVRNAQPREGSAMRTRTRPKELPTHYRWPDSVTVPHPAPSLPVPHHTLPPAGPAPTPPTSGPGYIVQPGDTLSGIAARFGIDWLTIYSANHAVIGNQPDRLLPGEKLTVPRVSPTQPLPYIVQPGDTLSGIAARLGIDWQKLYSANHAVIGNDPNQLLPSKRFTIP